MAQLPENPLLAAYEAAWLSYQAATQARVRAVAAEKKAEAGERMAKYALIVSIPCPFCAAQVNEPCTDPNRVGPRPEERHSLGLRAQHGVRADLSGANGEYSYELARAKEDG